MKNASVPEDRATPRYHHLEARIAATKENAVGEQRPAKDDLIFVLWPRKAVYEMVSP
jgi:hypothetical protein